MTNVDTKRLKYEIRLAKKRIGWITERIDNDIIKIDQLKQGVRERKHEIEKLRRYIGDTEKNLSKLKKGK